ncbi:MAG: hypothetical protein JW982_12335 [Spirochaetes bacterium]|nr:hypothetical protein [Spirochaetota bacterium]
MKKIIIIFILLSSVSAFSGSAKNQVEFTFEKGSSWYHEIKAGFIKIKGTPQVALWTETTDGKFIETVYVSKKAYKWYKKGTEDRLDVLPVWQSRENSDVDAVSGATISEESSLHREISSADGKIIMFAEINNSFDYNDFYTEKGDGGTVKTGVNGQPSLIYSVEIDFGVKKQYKMNLTGHGSIGRKSGVIGTDMNRISTAKNIVRSIYVTVK